MRLSLIPLFFFFFTSVSAQIIQVLEKENNTPISGVAVFNSNKNKSGITDLDGFVEISEFSDIENIIFQHISHINITTSKEEILKNDGVVYLEIDSSNLDEVILSISKFEMKKKDIPQKIVSVTQEDIQFSNPQTSADLLENSGLVFIQKSQLGGGSPMIRGFSTNRLLIAVDGTRFNNAIFRGGNVQNVISIDPFAIDRTEIILGPGSVVYGSDAIGGVMNFYTKKPKFSFVDGFSFSGSVTTRYSTASNERTGHIDFNIGMKEWSFLSSFTYTDFDDLRMGSHGPDDYLRPDYVETIDGEDVVIENSDPKVQVPTGYNQINAMQKIRFMPNDNWDFNLGLFYTTTSDYPRYDRLYRISEKQLRSAIWEYGPQEWLSSNLQISNNNTKLYDKSILTLSYQRFLESRKDRDFGDIFLYENKEEVDAYTAAFDLSKNFGDNKLFYGLEYVFNRVGSTGLQTNIENGETEATVSRYPDGSTWQSMALYGSWQWKFEEDLSLQSGVRYNHILLKADFDFPFIDFPFEDKNLDTGALTGSVGLHWKASKILDWKLNFSTAFRAPNIDDVGKIFDSEPGSVVVPNPDLKPEYAYNGELGVYFNFEELFKVDVGAFYTYLDDALVRRDFNLDGVTEIEYQGELRNLQAIQNASMAEIYGLEAGIEIKFNQQLKLISQYTITDGYGEEEDGSKVGLRHVAPQFGNTHLIWQNNKLKLDAFAEYNGKIDFEDLAPSEQNKPYLYAADENGNPYAPSWYTLNLGGQYKVIEALRINAVLENITDQRYRTYSSGIAAPGINLIISLNYQF
jgi:hemoglobin/transferrin/lactoferrin receptor protein